MPLEESQTMNTRAKAKKAKRAEVAKLEDCAICMSAIELPLVACEGMHQYHRECLDGWISNGRTSCPTCRRPILTKVLDESPATAGMVFQMIRDGVHPQRVLGAVRASKLHNARLPEFPRYTLVHIACIHKRDEILKAFTRDCRFDFEAPDDEGNTPFHHAMKDELCAMTLLFKVNVTPDALNFYGETPLHILCETGNTQILNILLIRASRIDFNRRTRTGSSPLELAILDNASDEFIRTLVRHGRGVQIDAQLPPGRIGDGGTAIMRAAWMGRKAVIEMLLGASPDRDASLRMKDHAGQTAVDYAEDQGNPHLATWLRQEMLQAAMDEKN